MTVETTYDSERDALVERLLQATEGTFALFTAYLGDRLGLYRELRANGPRTSADLATATGTHERYTREWLEQQVVAGILHVDDPASAANVRKYALPAAHAEVLCERESPNFLAPLLPLTVATVRPLDHLVEAFGSGDGVPLSAYGRDMTLGQGGLNRVPFLTSLTAEWIPAMPDVDERLRAAPAARVAELGSGAGWASIGVALGYPGVTVDGFDMDSPSVELARANAAEKGVADRVRFRVEDAAAVSARDGTYDLVLALECIHDMADPVGALRTMRELAGGTGAVMVMDERVGDSFADRNPDTEWFMYGFSVLHCLPASMATAPSAAIGTVMRSDRFAELAREAGFAEARELPIENFFYKFYRLMI